MVQSPRRTGRRRPPGPADIAMRDLVRFAEHPGTSVAETLLESPKPSTPKASPPAAAPPSRKRRTRRSPRRRREPWVTARKLQQLVDAGYKPRQIAQAADLSEREIRECLEFKEDTSVPCPQRAKTLKLMLELVRDRSAVGLSPDSTCTWWDTAQAELGWQRPQDLVHSDPKRLKASIKPLSETKSFPVEPRYANRQRWLNLPGAYDPNA